MSTIAARRRRPLLPRLSSLDESNPLVPWLLLLPHALFFFAFIVYPVGRGLLISLQRWDPLRSEVPFVGLQHYIDLLTPTSAQFGPFWSSMLNTGFFTVIATPLLIALALGLALLLNKPIRGRSIFRSIFFLPSILSVSVISIVWRWLFGDDIGVLSIVLRNAGITPPHFISDSGWAWIPILLSTLWWTVGLNMVLYMAGLAGISESYDEAAQLDGAGTWRRFRSITWPLLAPTTLFVTVTTVLASAQLYGQSLLITDGGPDRSTTSVMMYITQQAFESNQMSSATAMSFVFGVFMLAVTIVQFRSMTRGVKGPQA
jgi:multiple sugar transport system permease protein